MYADILSPASYGRFNRKLVKLTNLTCAVYWSELLDVISRVVKKSKFDSDGFFILDRKYITEQTGISESEQLECDKVLTRLSVLESKQDDLNKLRVCLENMTAILIDDDLKELKSIKVATKISRAEKVASKKEAIIGMLKDSIIEPDQELKEAYCNLVDVLYDVGICKKAQLKVFFDTINAYTSDREVKLELINKAITLGYRDCSWVINAYEKDHRPGTRLQKQAIATAVNKDIEF